MPLPTVILPGYLAGSSPYGGMEAYLKTLGYPAVTVPLTRWTWLPTLGGRSITPIIECLAQTIEQTMASYQVDRVNLVGHSAGGWIGRIYLGDRAYDIHPRDRDASAWSGHRHVARLITLGTPHTSQERWTRRNLDFVNQTYPGAFESDVTYFCVAGKSVYGKRDIKGWFTYNSYQLTSGQGNCWGDGITPIVAAHLEGATNMTLPNVYHSPQPGVSWYGTPKVIEQWAGFLG
ncbi:MAG: lipase [Cyanobacteria bacterium J06642_9]